AGGRAPGPERGEREHAREHEGSGGHDGRAHRATAGRGRKGGNAREVVEACTSRGRAAKHPRAKDQMTETEAWDALRAHVRRIEMLDGVMGTLAWDEQTM